MNVPLQSIVRLEEIALDRRFCNNCDRQITDESQIGDAWWEIKDDGADVAVIFCRDCA